MDELSIPQVRQLIALNKAIEPQKYTLEPDICTIGRSASCNVIVPSNIVSRLHAKIEFNNGRYVLHDCNSANGTYVNRRRIFSSYALQDKDHIGLGDPTPLLAFIDPDRTALLRPRLDYDDQQMLFTLNYQPLTLSPAQFKLLSYLFEHAGQVCTREACAQVIWGRDYDPGLDADALDRALATLRQQLRRVDPSADLIQTRRGLGYILEF